MLFRSGAATLLIVNYLVVRFLYKHQQLDHLIEGGPDVLIADGKVRMNRLQKELITESELETAAHRQGFSSLAEIERAILEPGGSICFFPKKPEPDVARHDEVMRELRRIVGLLEKSHA